MKLDGQYISPYPMSEERRILHLMVMDGDASAAPLLYHLDKYRRADELLKWLIRNGLTGRRFVEWVKCEHGNSVLKAGAYLLMKIEHEKKTRPVLIGDDYLTR
jgi:tRNA A37 threonylcarbamoyladenosine biosynthesis protein TsaE